MEIAVFAVPDPPGQLSSTPPLTTETHGRGPSTLVGDTPVRWVAEPFADGGKGFWNSEPADIENHPVNVAEETQTTLGAVCSPGAAGSGAQGWSALRRASEGEPSPLLELIDVGYALPALPIDMKSQQWRHTKATRQ